MSAAPAAAAAVKSTTPLHPPQRKASVSRISDSHSCAVHGAPGIEWLKGSAARHGAVGDDRFAVARCDQASPSASRFGEAHAKANRRTATSPTTRPEAWLSPLAERAANGRAMDMARKCAGGAIRAS